MKSMIPSNRVLLASITHQAMLDCELIPDFSAATLVMGSPVRLLEVKVEKTFIDLAKSGG
jgi:hypothetical protein